MTQAHTQIGQSARRIDGALKVTGAARYAAEYAVPGLLYGYVVNSAITKGRILKIDTAAAMARPGVVAVLTHDNRPSTAWFDRTYHDQVAPPGHPFRALAEDRILYSGQPVALVVAETFEAARDAAPLLHVTYREEEHVTELDAVKGQSYVPPKQREGTDPPPKPRGNADRALDGAVVRVEAQYRSPVEIHNPMETYATTVHWHGDGTLTIYDKTQGAQNVQEYVAGVFGFAKSDVRVVNEYVGGAFGSGLRPQYSLWLAVAAAKQLQRSVRVALTRDQMFTLQNRPETIQTVALGAELDGKLSAIRHHAVAATSHYEDHQEVVVNWSGVLYDAPNAKLTYELAKLDTASPTSMRAPGAALGVYAIECAMDELAYACRLDPIELRLRNYTERAEDEDKEFTSKSLKECYAEGARRFGWAERSPEPRSMRDGSELVGWGMASGVWQAKLSATAAEARVALRADGTLDVASAATDIGTGTWTIVAQIGADAMGLELDAIHVRIGDSSLPTSPVAGGSWTAASNGSAVMQACDQIRRKLFAHAQGMGNPSFKAASYGEAILAGGRIALEGQPSVGFALTDVLRDMGEAELVGEGSVKSDPASTKKWAGYTHSANFAEVRVDEELGVIRVTRLVCAVAAGKIINPRTARSQILGGLVMGVSAALHEEALTDHNLGRFMNHNFAEYHIAANADIGEVDIAFIPEHDDKVAPLLGVKGLGEIGIVGSAAAVANAVYHATGRRIRDLPITIDKLLR